MQLVTPRLAPLRLPMMAATHRDLSELLKKVSARNPDLQPLMLKDPGAAIGIFRLLAELKPGAANQITDIAHAISLMGFGAVERLLDETPVAEPGRDHASQAIALAYSQAAHAAHFAQVLAEGKNLPRPTELATSALVQQPAVLALAVHDPEALLRASYAVQEGVPTDAAFQAELGESINHANRTLAEHWGLPHLAQEAMDNRDMQATRSIPVRLAGDLALAMTFGRCSEETGALVALFSNFLHRPVDQVSGLLHAQAAQAARDLYSLGYPTAAFECLFLPLPQEAEDDIPEELQRLWAKKAKRPTADTATQAAASTPKRSAPAQPARPDLQQTLTQIMQRMREDAGLERVMFSLLGKDRRQLQARLFLGSAKDDVLRRFASPVGGKDLFSLLLKKPQSIWVNAANLDRYQAHLLPPLDQLPSKQGWFAMSLFVRNKPMGLFYADGGTLDDQAYQRFRQLVQRASNALNGTAKPG